MAKTIIRPGHFRSGSVPNSPVIRSKDFLFTGLLLASQPTANIVDETNLILEQLEDVLSQAAALARRRRPGRLRALLALASRALPLGCE
jgi:hypothetical protein